MVPYGKGPSLNESFIFETKESSFSIFHSFSHVAPQKLYSEICRWLHLAGFLNYTEL